MFDRRISGLVVASLALLPACGNHAVSATTGPGDDVGYTDATDVVVAGPTTWIVTGDPDGCVQLGSGPCIDIATVKTQYCGSPDAQADIVVVAGNVVRVICYPPVSSGVSIDQAGTSSGGTTTVPQTANDAVITFAPATNGKPVEGDVRFDGENVSIIGNGIDKTVFGGNLTLNSNNFHLRGLTVLGNLVLEKNCNNASVAFVKVKGNLTVAANDVTLLNTIVFGDLEVTGESASLVNVGVQGKVSFQSPALLCDSSFAFTDQNGDLLVEATEMGAALTCK